MKREIQVLLPEGWSTEELEELIKNGAQVLPKRVNIKEAMAWAGMWTSALLFFIMVVIGPARISGAFHRSFEQPYERVVWVTPTADPDATPTETPTPTATRFVNNDDSGNLYRYGSKTAHDQLVAARETMNTLIAAIPCYNDWGMNWQCSESGRKELIEQAIWIRGMKSVDTALSEAGSWLSNNWTPPPHDSSNPLLDTHARLSLAWGDLVIAYDRLYCFQASERCDYSTPQHWLDMAGSNLDAAMDGWNLSRPRP